MIRTVVATTVILSIAAGADVADAKVRTCHSSSSANVQVSSARNMTCKKARRDIRRYRGSIKRRFTTPGGFKCHRVSGNRLGGQWRCVKGSRAYRFEFGD
ncbi:MAG: hypothetical protein QOH76_3508 [Thermoleophilaceae bacterium]|jgi:hypothetical protein|nr:hypothetical protein [Thermoleophilaceae bacterium]